MTPATRADRIETRRRLAAYARHHNWHTVEPHPGAWWVLLELWDPQRRIRINIRWTHEDCNATIADYTVVGGTWTWPNPTVADLEWLAANPDTIHPVADLLAHRPAVIDLRETA